MATLIQSPELASTTPPFFSLDVGHSAKVFAGDCAIWVKVIDIRGDSFLGIVRSSQPGTGTSTLRTQDVIEFARENIFGMF